MSMDFDKIVERHDTDAVKTDSLKKNFGRSDLIPLWVADMDFESPRCIREALQEVVDSGLYGYNVIPEDYFPVIKKWLGEEQGWTVEEQWLSFIPGVVKGIGYIINFFTGKGDGIIVQPPVYPPFMNVPAGNDRKIVFNPLIRLSDSDSRPYAMDFEHLKKIASEGNCRALILSNPHNPGGIAWDRESLIELADICYKYNILVIADEIHADMPLFGGRHIPFASVSRQAEKISITLGAPSKTFNMAGIVSSYAVVPEKELREPFYRWLAVNELNSPTIMATRGAMAAYTKGNEWRREMLAYIEKNILFVEEFCKRHFTRFTEDPHKSCPDGNIEAEPGNTPTGIKGGNSIQLIKPLRPQASFLVWLDCRELGRVLWENKRTASWSPEASQQLITDLFINKARLALNDGSTFGPGGAGYMRLNVGTPKQVLEEALRRLAYSVNSEEQGPENRH